MKSDPPNYDELQRLLASRRLVRPPSGVLENFSERVTDRIKYPDPPGPLTWRQRLGLDADARPAVMCAWGVALCASLAVGILVSLNLFQQQSGLQKQIGAMPGGDQISKAWEQFGATPTTSHAPVSGSVGSSVAPIFANGEQPAP